jgi:uncharacterized protein (TIGR00369 family)
MNQTQPGALAQPESSAWVDGVIRSRTYTWEDPSATLAALADLPGIELLAAIGRGELPAPPLMRTLGFEPVEVGHGRMTFAMTPAEMHYNPLGSVHGGVIATLLDSAAGCAVHSLLPAGMGYSSLDLTTKYLRPVSAETGRVIVTGTVLSKGSRTALAEARLTDSHDRLLAYATSSCLLFSLSE